MEKESKDPKTLFEDLINEVKNDEELISGMKEYNLKKKNEEVTSNKEFEEFMEAYMNLVDEMNSRGLSRAFKELYPDYEQDFKKNLEIDDIPIISLHEDALSMDEINIPVIDLEQEVDSDRRVETMYIELKNQEENKKKKTFNIKGISKDFKAKYKNLDNKIKGYREHRKIQKNDKKIEKEQKKIEKIANKVLKEQNREQKREQRKDKIKNSRVIKGAKTFVVGSIILSQEIGKGVKSIAEEAGKAAGKAVSVAEKTGKEALKRFEQRKDQTILSTLKFVKGVNESLNKSLEERISKREDLNKTEKPKQKVTEKQDKLNTMEL